MTVDQEYRESLKYPLGMLAAVVRMRRSDHEDANVVREACREIVRLQGRLSSMTRLRERAEDDFNAADRTLRNLGIDTEGIYHGSPVDGTNGQGVHGGGATGRG